MMIKRFYYYTGPVAVADADFLTDGERAATKAIVQRMHELWRSAERGEQSQMPDAVAKRIEDELQRRANVGRTSLIRVLQCSASELDAIRGDVFDTIPDILLVEEKEHD